MNNKNIILIVIVIIVIYTLYVNSKSLSNENDSKENFSLLSNISNSISTSFNRALNSGTVSKIKNIF
jgi:uncharacterized membrane protein